MARQNHRLRRAQLQRSGQALTDSVRSLGSLATTSSSSASKATLSGPLAGTPRLGALLMGRSCSLTSSLALGERVVQRRLGRAAGSAARFAASVRALLGSLRSTARRNEPRQDRPDGLVRVCCWRYALRVRQQSNREGRECRETLASQGAEKPLALHTHQAQRAVPALVYAGRV